jgi:hypothetical protein
VSIVFERIKTVSREFVGVGVPHGGKSPTELLDLGAINLHKALHSFSPWQSLLLQFEVSKAGNKNE